MKRIVRALAYIILLSILPSGAFFLLPTWVGYHIVESYTFSSQQAEPLFGLSVLLPASGAYQKVENVHFEWAGEIARQPEHEVEVVILEPAPAQGGTLTAELAYDVSLRQGRVSWDAEIEAEDLLPQKWIESDTPELMNAAEQICRRTPKDCPYSIYAFTARHLSWPKGIRVGADPSALAAYQSKVGVCGEFANLMTALARAEGIPIRSISGLSLPMFQLPLVQTATTWNHPGGAHAWVEVVTGSRWVIADPSWASGVPVPALWFGRSLGQYLSYGEVGEHERIYNGSLAWGEAHGAIIGAMSAPLKFVAISSDAEAQVTPAVTVKKVRDNRWLLGVGVYILLVLILIWIERKIKLGEQAGKRL